MPLNLMDPVAVEDIAFPHGVVIVGCDDSGRQVCLNLDGMPVTDDPEEYVYVRMCFTQETEPGSGKHKFVETESHIGRLLLKDDLGVGEFVLEVRPLREDDRETPRASTLATGNWDFIFGKCIALVAVDRSSYTRC